MPKLQISASEVQDPKVNIVAMVKRGANRLPFKIMKEDGETMLDLAKVGRDLFRKADKGPTLIGVVFSKSMDAEAVAAATEILTKTGAMEPGKFVKSDSADAVSFMKADHGATAEDTFVLKASDDVAFVIKADAALVKSLSTYDWESTSFSEVMSKGAFTPSVCMAQEMLQRTFFNIMEKADNNTELANLMKSAIGEFQGYVTTLAKGLPVTVFKADAELSKAMPPWLDKKKKGAKDKEADKKDMKKDEPVEKVFKDGEVVPADAKVTKGDVLKKKDGTLIADGEVTAMVKAEEISANPAVGNGTPTQSGIKVDLKNPAKNDIEANPVAGNQTDANDPTKKPGNNAIESSPVGGGMNGPIPELQKNEGDADVGKKGKGNQMADDKSGSGAQQADPALEAVTKMAADLTKAMTDGMAGLKAHVDTSIGSIKKEVDKVSAAVRKTDEALNGTVLGDAAGDKTGIMMKDEGSGAPPLLDTAFMKLDAELPLDRKKPVTH